MAQKIRILFLSANPWTTSRILVDEEAREVFEKLQEGSHREHFELHKHAAIRPADLQRLLLMYKPHIVHFSGHGHKKQRIILGGTPGRGKLVDRQGLVDVFALYRSHLRLVFLNACFTRLQASSLSEVIDFAIGTGRGIGDKGSVVFAGAFYRALAFGLSIIGAFASAKAELALTKVPRTQGLELFVRDASACDHFFPPPDSGLSLSNRNLIHISADLPTTRSETDEIGASKDAFAEPGWSFPPRVAHRLVLIKYERVESGILRCPAEQEAISTAARQVAQRTSEHERMAKAGTRVRQKHSRSRNSLKRKNGSGK
jgi:hypothetical protein